MAGDIKRYFYTINYMKVSQLSQFFLKQIIKSSCKFTLNQFYPKLKRITLLINNSFNCRKSKPIKIFNEQVDLLAFRWRYNNKTALWNYHLHYFDYLLQLKEMDGIALIDNWITHNPPKIAIAWDPYPISLRVVNWIKFIAKYNISDQAFYKSLYLQGYCLFKQREYHLLANHLFKNIVALLFLGFLFNNSKWINWTLKELKKQLQEQTTTNGYHFEFSPTYHSLFIKDILDIYNLLSNNSEKTEISYILEKKIKQGLHWLDYFSKDGAYYKINDINFEGCPSPVELVSYAKMLDIKYSKSEKISGEYPIIRNNGLEIMMYCVPVSPKYNPAHSHADISSILLWFKNKEILIETGNYDYEESSEREYSRSTKAHNTISINSADQNDNWKVFRIGRRAKILEKCYKRDMINCSHNGYDKYGVIHERSIKKISEGFQINDMLKCKKRSSFELFYHFAPGLELVLQNNVLYINSELQFVFPEYDVQFIKTEHYPRMFTKSEKQTIIISGEIMNNTELNTYISIK